MVSSRPGMTRKVFAIEKKGVGGVAVFAFQLPARLIYISQCTNLLNRFTWQVATTSQGDQEA